MAAIFSQVLNMSMTGSVVILLVMLARLILKRAPKVFSYALWSVVLFRLLCPVAFTSPISVLDVVEPEQKEASNNTSIVTYIPATVNTQADFIMMQPEEQQVQVESVTESEEQLLMTPMHAAALAWAAGMAGMMLYSVIQYLALRRKLVGSVRLKGNIYLADHIDTAFVVGLVQPRIYLPSGVPSKERYYILAHEQHHIRRFDHLIKLLAYLALCIHWFNPLVWLAFVLAGKDMEMSCDEAVIRKLGAEIRADYSASLLRLATHKKILSGMPLAFGEGDTKGRILNMAKWKKPAKWMVAVCALICLIVVCICAFNPEKKIPIEELTRQTSEGLVDTAIGDLCFTYPGGLTSEQRDVDNWNEEDRTRNRRNLPTRRPYNHFFIDNGVDFGGVVDFIVPESRQIILEEMNLPTQWQGLDYIAGNSNYPYAEMEYTLVKDGKDYIQMYLYTYSGRGYFLWFYTEEGNPVNKEAILNSVELGSFSHLATKLKRDEIVSLGQFNVTVPKGYGYHRNEAKILEITKKDLFNNQTLLGCVTAIPNPNLPIETAEDRIKWVEAIGINLSYEGRSYGYSITDEKEYGDIYVNREEVLHGNTVMAENHYIYIAGDIVYDLCFNALEINSAEEMVFLDSIWIKESYNLPSENHQATTVGVPQPMDKTDGYMSTVPSNDIGTVLMGNESNEMNALKQCKSALETIQSGSYHIAGHKSITAPGSSHKLSAAYFSHDENWMHITYLNVGNGDMETQHRMKVNGKILYNVESTVKDNIVWGDGDISEPELPWLVNHIWDESKVVFKDMHQMPEQKTVTVQINEPFYIYPEESNSYLVTFFFDGNDNFLQVTLQAEVIRSNGVWTAEETQSVVSLDPEIVNDMILAEYQRIFS